MVRSVLFAQITRVSCLCIIKGVLIPRKSVNDVSKEFRCWCSYHVVVVVIRKKGNRIRQDSINENRDH